MSFFNPSIQATFDSDKFQFINVSDYLVASYSILYHVKSEYNLLPLNKIIDSNQLEFVKFISAKQQNNFALISPTFHLIIASIAIDVFLGKICSFDSYIQSIIDSTEKNISLNIIFLREYVIEFIEFLVFSNIASNTLCNGYKDFSNLMGKRLFKAFDYPVFYNLYDRLKLYERLQRDFILQVNHYSLSGSNLILNFTIRI